MQQRYYDPIAGRFLSVDPITTNAKTGGKFNRYGYAENNPYKYADSNGEDSFLVGRPLGNDSSSRFFVHNFVVANATRIGDPKASVFSFGKQNDGNTGRVNESTEGASKGTSDRDAAYWKSLADNPSLAKEMSTEINAEDASVVQAADSLKASTEYILVPAMSAAGTNSNSAASAVADRVQGSKVKLPSAEGRRAVGAEQRDRIKFEEGKEKQ